MMSKNAVVSVVLFKGKHLANGEHPIVVRITFNGKRKHISLGISCTADLWDEKAQKPKRNHPNKLFIKSIIDEKKKDYREKILELNAMGKDYTPETLVSAVEKVVQKTLTVGSYFKEHIEAMEKARQLRNSKVYGETAHVVQQFHGTKDLLFSDIDVRWLNKFEMWLRSRNLKETTLSFYFRTLRALYRRALSEKLIKRDWCPFEEFKVGKFNTKTQKRALSKEKVLELFALDLPDDSKTWFAQQM